MNIVRHFGGAGLLRSELGYDNVHTPDGVRSLSQQGNMKRARRDGADIVVDSWRSAVGVGRLRRYRLSDTSFYSGITGPVNHIILALGESTGAGATADGSGTSDPVGAITLLPPMPGVLDSLNGGPMPHQFGASKGSGAHTTAIDAGQIASLVDAYGTINPAVTGRETTEIVLGETIGLMVRPGDKVTVANRSVGSCDMSEIYGSTGTPAQPFVDLQTIVARIVTLRPTYTNIIVAFAWPGSTEDHTVQSIATYQTQFNTVRTLVDGLKALTGQTQAITLIQPQIGPPRRDGIHESTAVGGSVDPATGVDANTNIAVLGSATNHALGALYQMVAAVDANFITRPRYEGHKGGTSDTGTAVHYQSQAYSDFWQAAGVLWWLKKGGTNVTSLHIVPGSIVRFANSTTVNFTLSKAAMVDTSVITDPAAHGLSYYANGVKATIDSVTISGTAGTIVLHSLPSTSLQEYLCTAFDNATNFVAPVWETLPNTDPGYPDGVVGTYGVGSTNGLRTTIRAVDPWGYRQRDGGPIYDWLAHDRQAAVVYASTGGLAAAITELAI